MTYKSEFLNTMVERGFIHQCTDAQGLDDHIWQNGKNAKAYIGFDPTSDSLHAGSLIQIMMLNWWQHCGHQAIALIGEATTQVGDPSGKDTKRKRIKRDTIRENTEVISNFIAFTLGKPRFISIINNIGWHSDMDFLPFINKVGSRFSLNRMLKFESVKNRLNSKNGMSFAELSYMLLQAYDFYYLAEMRDCFVQMGGSDQWGNIVCGIELGTKLKHRNLFGLTSPLLTTSNGKKMGKSEKGTVWLDKRKLSSFDLWQYWRNVDDQDVSKFLRLFTMLPMSEVKKLEALQGAEINEAKKILANEVVKKCHGEADANQAGEKSREVFEKIDADAVPRIDSDKAPTITITETTSVPELLVQFRFCRSRSEARKLIKNNEVSLDGYEVTDVCQTMTRNRVNQQYELSAGKHKRGIVKCPKKEDL